MFRTEIHIPQSVHKIGLKSKMLSIGSCFANAIGNRLKENKFQVSVNPFGVIFNPISIFKLLQPFTLNEKDYVNVQDIFFHYDFHSDFSGLDKEALKNLMQTQINETQKSLKDLDILMITLGTAFVYELKENRQIVANCHKQPAGLFEKRLLGVDEIIDAFQKLYQHLQIQNPKLKIILTLSPVRHTKDTLPLNAVSKSILRLAIHEITTQFPEISYFPAYEILMDDLRDYRFYKSDLIHPNEMAEDYIWEKFSNAFLDAESKVFLTKWSKIQKDLAHKPSHPESKSHQIFLKNLLIELQNIAQSIDVNEEIEKVKNALVLN